MDPRFNVVFLNARAGDPRAFRELIEALAPDLVRFTSFLLEGDRDGAQDVVQEVFIEAWKRLAGLESAEHMRRWSYRVARCRAASLKRRHGQRWRRLQQLSTIEDISGLKPWRSQHPRTVEHVRERTAVFRALRHALYRLPRDYGAPVQLHYLQGFGLRETAALLGVSVSSVKMRLVRARARLRRTLDGTSGPPAVLHKQPAVLHKQPAVLPKQPAAPPAPPLADGLRRRGQGGSHAP